MTTALFLLVVAICVALYAGVQVCLGFDASRFDDDGRKS